MTDGAICFLLGCLTFCVGWGLSFVENAINRLADVIERKEGEQE